MPFTWPEAFGGRDACEEVDVRLAAREAALADARRLLERAARLRGGRHDADVRALAELAADVHRRVAGEVFEAPPAEGEPG